MGHYGQAESGFLGLSSIWSGWNNTLGLYIDRWRSAEAERNTPQNPLLGYQPTSERLWWINSGYVERALWLTGHGSVAARICELHDIQEKRVDYAEGWRRLVRGRKETWTRTHKLGQSIVTVDVSLIASFLGNSCTSQPTAFKFVVIGLLLSVVLAFASFGVAYIIEYRARKFEELEDNEVRRFLDRIQNGRFGIYPLAWALGVPEALGIWSALILAVTFFCLCVVLVGGIFGGIISGITLLPITSAICVNIMLDIPPSHPRHDGMPPFTVDNHNSNGGRGGEELQSAVGTVDTDSIQIT